MTENITTEIKDNIFHIVLNRTDARNAITLPMIEALDKAVDDAERAFHANEARVIIVRAEGRVFSSGMDFMALDEYVALYGERWQENLFATTHRLQNALTKLERSSMPSICLLHGFCIGTGFEIALACDFRFAAERTRLSLPETRLGLIPDVGGTVRLVKLVGPSRAKEIILTGSTLDLPQALEWGVINRIVPKDDLMASAERFADELIQAAPMAVNYAKRVINDIVAQQHGLNIEAWAQAALFKSEDFASSVRAMQEKTPVEWKNK
ncbi:MAG: enoyl-CoA hydratase/isomerase family protein [Chloroflexota bacterium]